VFIVKYNHTPDLTQQEISLDAGFSGVSYSKACLARNPIVKQIAFQAIYCTISTATFPSYFPPTIGV
jgi:hypothetical protein